MDSGERIKELRKSLNLTLEKFGDRLGVTKTAISNIEKGNRNLTEQMTKAICREFGVDYIWLTTGEGEMFPDADIELMAAIDRIMADETDVRRNFFKFLSSLSKEEVETMYKIMQDAFRFVEEIAAKKDEK